MTFHFREAKREGVRLLLGFAGGTGSGKTYSAMRVARGLANGKRFAVIDTENGRASYYADEFDFDVGELKAPFRPDRYADAIETADKAGYPVIVVDSASHEWEGDGGMLDWHEEEFQRLGGQDRVKMTAWIKPKAAHRKMVTRLLQVNAHVILCFRAAEKVEMVRGEGGRMEVVPKKTLTGLDGWVPIADKALPYELTMSVLLVADRPGVPRPIKLPEKLKAFVPLDQPIGEDAGKGLLEWAAGEEGAVPEHVRRAAELLELAEQLGARDATEESIAKNLKLAGDDLPDHVAWLNRQIKTARKNLEAKAGAGDVAPADQPEPNEPEGEPEDETPEPTESLFQAPAGARMEPGSGE